MNNNQQNPTKEQKGEENDIYWYVGKVDWVFTWKCNPGIISRPPKRFIKEHERKRKPVKQ